MASFNVFQRADADLLQWIEAEGQSDHVPAGTTLIREGEPDQRVLILRRGTLVATTANPLHRQERLADLHAGSLVGEMSWLERRPTVATISASTDSEVLALSGHSLDQLDRNQPHLAAQLYRLIAQKLALQIQAQNIWSHRQPSPPMHAEALRKVLMLFANLQEPDVFLLARLGHLQRVAPQATLMQQGDALSGIALVLSGEAEIQLTLDGSTKCVGRAKRGEILGDMTLLLEDQAGASASVRSPDGMDLLCIDHAPLLKALAHDSSLACRFYRGLACMLSQRSRDQLLSHQRAAASQQAELDAIDRLDLDELAAISRAARHFDWLCRHFQTGEAASA